MKISKLASIALLGGALMAFGCSDSDNGSGGSAGTGGTAGGGGEGGAGGDVPPAACIPAETMCSNGEIGSITPCCTLPAPPDIADVCDGTESLENPASCTATGSVVTHQLTVFQIAGDCNVGYDLDSCDGVSCINGGLAPGEGVDGVDNALAGLAPILAGVGGNLSGVNQAFSDALCGQSGDACDQPVTPLSIQFGVDANTEENCANVDLILGGEPAGTVILNLGPVTNGLVCASGTLGTIPLEIGGTAGQFDNAVVRMTIAGGQGFANGVLGATVPADTAVAIAEALLEGAGAVVGQVLDINADLSGDNEAGCDSLSTAYSIGGVVVGPEPQ
jgi:hypothetical protein